IIGIDQEIESMETESAVERLMDTVNSLINQLTAKQAVVFTLKEGFRFQLKEIADLLDSSEMAIKSTLFRARQTLARDSRQHVKPTSEENEQTLLYDLIYRSLQTDDPQVLIDNLNDIPSLLEVPVQKKPTPKTQTPLNVYSMAA